MHGFFGKIPSHGDFITRNLSRNFLDAWDRWLQESVAESKARLGEGWLDVYLTSPIWRFALMPELCGRRGWAGVLMPSVDRVGRYFPLTIATPLPEGVHPMLAQARGGAWFNAVESLALRTLDDDPFEASGLEAALETVAPLEAEAAPIEALSLAGGAWSFVAVGPGAGDVPAAFAHGLVERGAGRYSLWWTPGSEQAGPAAFATAGLPEPRSFTELLHATFDAAAGLAAPASADEAQVPGSAP